EEFIQCGQSAMPRFGVCLAASLSRVHADKGLTSDVGKRIELKRLFIGSGSLVQLFPPREYIALPNPRPYVFAVECDGVIEVHLGLVQIARIVRCRSLLGKSQ